MKGFYPTYGCFDDELNPLFSQEQWLQQFNTNFFGPAAVTRALLPHFRAKRAGKLAFVGSALGLEGNAGVGAYTATKFAMEGQQITNL